MHSFSISQKGNVVHLAGEERSIRYELLGAELGTLADFSFAVWHVLPYAMEKRFDFHIDGPVDPTVIKNAVRMSQIWEMWRPERFRELAITSSEAASPRAGDKRSITMFSGGVDSTNMLIEMGRQESVRDVLTVHGMEYLDSDQAGFDALCRKTDPVLEDLNFRRIVLKSNAREIARGEHGWGMSIAGSAFLLSGVYSEAHFAADSSWEQDMESHPWGSNHVTNRMFFGARFRLTPWSEHVTRSEKIGVISRNPSAMQSITFCSDKSKRPDNCGICKKCLRTKIMFVAETGDVPDIFLDKNLPKICVRKMKLADRHERAFFIDAYQRARKNGHAPKLDRLEDAMSKLRRIGKIRNLRSKIFGYLFRFKVSQFVTASKRVRQAWAWAQARQSPISTICRFPFSRPRSAARWPQRFREWTAVRFCRRRTSHRADRTVAKRKRSVCHCLII